MNVTHASAIHDCISEFLHDCPDLEDVADSIDVGEPFEVWAGNKPDGSDAELVSVDRRVEIDGETYIVSVSKVPE